MLRQQPGHGLEGQRKHEELRCHGAGGCGKRPPEAAASHAADSTRVLKRTLEPRCSEEFKRARVELAERHGAHAHAARLRRVHEQLPDHLGRVGKRDRVDVRVQRAGDHQAPEAVEGPLCLPLSRQPCAQALGRIARDRAHEPLEGAPRASLSPRERPAARKRGRLCSGAGSHEGPRGERRPPGSIIVISLVQWMRSATPMRR
jgi:hypothetical protein